MVRKFFILFLSLNFLVASISASAQQFQFGQPNMPQIPGAYLQKGIGSKKSASDFGSTMDERKQRPQENTMNLGGSSVTGGLSYQVHILGQVQTPGTYRVELSTRLVEAITFAGSILNGGSKRRVELRRDGKVIRFDLLKFQRFGDLSQNPFLLDNDVIFIPYSEGNVSIQGAVKSVGIYELTNTKSLWDLIELAGGYTVGLSEKEPLTVIRFVHGEKNLVKIENIERDLKNFELLNGDTVVIPHMFGDNRRFDYNITELPADNVFYPTQNSNVYVVGGVARGGAYDFLPNLSVRDFVNMAGPTKLSRPELAYVLTGDGKTVRHLKNKKDFHLSPGDTIYVPERKVTFGNVMAWYNTFLTTFFSAFAFQQVVDKLD